MDIITIIGAIILVGMVALLVRVLADERARKKEQEDDEPSGSSSDAGSDSAR